MFSGPSNLEMYSHHGLSILRPLQVASIQIPIEELRAILSKTAPVDSITISSTFNAASVLAYDFIVSGSHRLSVALFLDKHDDWTTYVAFDKNTNAIVGYCMTCLFSKGRKCLRITPLYADNSSIAIALINFATETLRESVNINVRIPKSVHAEMIWEEIIDKSSDSFTYCFVQSDTVSWKCDNERVFSIFMRATIYDI